MRNCSAVLPWQESWWAYWFSGWTPAGSPTDDTGETWDERLTRIRSGHIQPPWQLLVNTDRLLVAVGVDSITGAPVMWIAWQ